MKLSFEGETLTHVIAKIGDFLDEVIRPTSVYTDTTDPVGPTSSPDGDQTEKPAKSTRTPRKRSPKSSASEPSDDAAEDEKPEPTRRRRSAKTSSAAAKTTAEDTSTSTARGSRRRKTSIASDEGGQETRQRRKKGETMSDTAEQDRAEDEPFPRETPEPTTRRRRARTDTPSDEIKDTDLSKAASGLAEATNPRVVLDLLTEFGVSMVSDLSGDARREFLDAVAELTKDEEDKS